MSREIITKSGAIVYRTKLMSDAAAARFASCLRGNSRFCDVETVESQTAKTPKSFVTFRPSSRERQGDMLVSQWNQRAERAATEGMCYIFVADSDHTGDYWCFNPISLETYQVSSFRCSCPDFVYRCDRAGIQCKHQQAWEMQSRAGTLHRHIDIAA